MSARLVTTVAEYRAACDAQRARGRRVVLVPTMGALHHAHRALMLRAREHGDFVATSIFVNPTQFGPSEDFARYPRDLAADLALCDGAGVELVFAPEASEMYPDGDATRVVVQRLTASLCGPFRPGHFDGVATVVTKLLTATGPCSAVFGRKDYQQLQVVRRLVRDLLLPVEIVDHPTQRDADGLATSSRNRYLSDADRRHALGLPRALSAVVRAFAAGERDVERLGSALWAQLRVPAVAVEYATLASARDLALLTTGSVEAGEAGAFIAARVGTTRLIDNVILGVDADPLALEGSPR